MAEALRRERRGGRGKEGRTPRRGRGAAASVGGPRRRRGRGWLPAGEGGRGPGCVRKRRLDFAREEEARPSGPGCGAGSAEPGTSATGGDTKPPEPAAGMSRDGGFQRGDQGRPEDGTAPAAPACQGRQATVRPRAPGPPVPGAVSSGCEADGVIGCH